jgi:hypothetical protein
VDKSVRKCNRVRLSQPSPLDKLQARRQTEQKSCNKLNELEDAYWETLFPLRRRLGRRATVHN